MRRLARILAGGLAAAVIAGCAGDDVSYYKRGLKLESESQEAPTEPGPIESYRLADLRPAHEPDPKSDEAGIWLQMEKVESRIRTAGNRVKDKALNAYVESVKCRVAAQFCKDIRVYVVRAAGFNAAMYPNGMMNIRTGLLLRVENEAQLAAVIGHEAGHYLRQHSLQTMREVIEKSNSLTFFNIALAAAGVPVVGDVATLMTMAGISAYGRNHEREADGYGLLLLARAGYDPDEAWKVWQQIMKERVADKDYEAPSFFFASHPQSDERMEQLRSLAKVVRTPESTDIGRERLQEVILPMRAGLLRDEMHRRNFDSFEALLEQLMARGANLAELHYFKGEMHRLRNNEGDLEKALESYRTAQHAEGTAPAGLFRSLGLVHLKLDQKEEARKAFAQYIQKNPQASDLIMVKQFMEGS